MLYPVGRGPGSCPGRECFQSRTVLNPNTQIKRQNILHQMWRDPAKAMELRDVKPGQGL